MKYIDINIDLASPTPQSVVVEANDDVRFALGVFRNGSQLSAMDFEKGIEDSWLTDNMHFMPNARKNSNGKYSQKWGTYTTWNYVDSDSTRFFYDFKAGSEESQLPCLFLIQVGNRIMAAVPFFIKTVKGAGSTLPSSTWFDSSLAASLSAMELPTQNDIDFKLSYGVWPSEWEEDNPDYEPDQYVTQTLVQDMIDIAIQEALGGGGPDPEEYQE